MKPLDTASPIWVVDDDKSIRWVLERALTRAGESVRLFDNALDVQKHMELEEPAVLVSDIRMPGLSGTDLLAWVKANHPDVAVIIMTAFSDLDSAVSAFQGGAFDYLAKPFELATALELIARAKEESLRKREAYEKENAGNGKAPKSDAPTLIGRAAAMQDVFRAIGRLSQSNVTVLVTGESGTGKEVIARSIWQHSQRAKAPFIAINMGAIPRELLESELFGHEKGAFTGASAQRLGRFEQAQGGTIFLDEIGEMPMELQTALLRVLSNGTFYRVGGHQPIHADVRVIAATNRNLEERVRQGQFREDLYHRLNVIRLRLPSLRERREDIGPLAEHFLALAATELNVEPKVLSPEARDVLEKACPFPGNIRQLENLCRWLTVMAPAKVVTVNDLPPDAFEPLRDEEFMATPRVEAMEANDISSIGVGRPSSSWKESLKTELSKALIEGKTGLWDTFNTEFERVVFSTTLESCHGSRQETAEKLGVGRNTVTRKIKELEIDA